MYFLMRAADKPIDTYYDWVMHQVIKLQGDCDTNAAIVGGVVGAYVGIDKIDPNKLQKVLNCEITE